MARTGNKSLKMKKSTLHLGLLGQVRGNYLIAKIMYQFLWGNSFWWIRKIFMNRFWNVELNPTTDRKRNAKTICSSIFKVKRNFEHPQTDVNLFTHCKIFAAIPKLKITSNNYWKLEINRNPTDMWWIHSPTHLHEINK